MPGSLITRALLDSYEGLHISAICTAVRFVDDEQNHCAHFVNHVLGFDAALSCGQLLGRSGASANIRVHETFARCPRVGDFAERVSDAPCLAFVTKRDVVNLAARTMQNIPRKHVGIFCDGEIWHYSNTARKVVRQTPADYAKHFTGADFATFFGTFPDHTGALTVPTVVATGDTPAAILKRGQRDNVDVAAWQQFLIIRKLLFGLGVHSLLDGDFGPMTEEATEAFQISEGLEANGTVDAATNLAAARRGFIPRVAARRRPSVDHVTAAMTAAAVDALGRLGPTSVFFTEELLHAGERDFIARLEPHKHTEGTQLRFWHRGITLYTP